MIISTLSDQIRALADLKEGKRQLSEQTKENNAQIEQAERTIISAMLDMAEAAGLPSPDDFSIVVDGRKYGVVVHPHYSIRAEDRDTAYAALRDVGLGDLIVERVDERSLTRALTQIADDAGGALPEAYGVIPLQQYDKITISDRKVGR